MTRFQVHAKLNSRPFKPIGKVSITPRMTRPRLVRTLARRMRARKMQIRATDRIKFRFKRMGRRR